MSATSSHKIVFWDASEYKEPEPPEVKEFEIWVGNYNLGQGYNGSRFPELIAKVKATSFKIACWLHELESQAESIREQMQKPNSYIENIHFGKLYYDPKTNSNSWLGKYYQSEKEAQESFK